MGGARCRVQSLDGEHARSSSDGVLMPVQQQEQRRHRSLISSSSVEEPLLCERSNTQQQQLHHVRVFLFGAIKQQTAGEEALARGEEAPAMMEQRCAELRDPDLSPFVCSQPAAWVKKLEIRPSDSKVVGLAPREGFGPSGGRRGGAGSGSARPRMSGKMDAFAAQFYIYLNADTATDPTAASGQRAALRTLVELLSRGLAAADPAFAQRAAAAKDSGSRAQLLVPSGEAKTQLPADYHATLSFYQDACRALVRHVPHASPIRTLRPPPPPPNVTSACPPRRILCTGCTTCRSRPGAPRSGARARGTCPPPSPPRRPRCWRQTWTCWCTRWRPRRASTPPSTFTTSCSGAREGTLSSCLAGRRTRSWSPAPRLLIQGLERAVGWGKGAR